MVQDVLYIVLILNYRYVRRMFTDEVLRDMVGSGEVKS